MGLSHSFSLSLSFSISAFPFALPLPTHLLPCSCPLPLSYTFPLLLLDLTALSAVTISVSLSHEAHEAHISCTYISPIPVSPRIRINGDTHTVSTLETASTLEYYHLLHCYYNSTMVNVFTIVLCQPKLYVGTVFECSFNLHGGEEVRSGPATLNLTATGMFSGSQCSPENTSE